MKKSFFIIVFLLSTFVVIGQNLKPYILGAVYSGSIDEVKSQVKTALEDEGFAIVGQYIPAEDSSRYVIIVNHSALNSAVASVGGLSGFAATLRLALTKEDQAINISYTNPVYWGNAYFRDDFDKVSSEYTKIETAFKQATVNIGEAKGTSFGSEKGLSIEDLRKYHYMFGMPYFEDTKKLAKFDNYEAAIAKIENSLKWGKSGVKMVYRHDIPNSKLTLYGFALSGENGEGNFLPKIDISTPKHSAFLPYEFLVNDNEVHMLHGRFRIALAFPDLTMGTFTKIMSTPGDIQDLLEQLVED